MPSNVLESSRDKLSQEITKTILTALNVAAHVADNSLQRVIAIIMHWLYGVA
jgi:hypothetical protein